MSARVPVRCPSGESWNPLTGKCEPAALGAVSHVQARELLASGFRQRFGRDASKCELQFAQAVALGEGGQYGSGCYRRRECDGGKPGDVVESHCSTNNWGAIQCRARPPCPPNCVEATDTHADGTCYQACFRTFPDAASGAAGYLDVLYGGRRGAVLAAAAAGDFDAAVAAMRATGYFEAPLAVYQGTVRTNAPKVARALGEPVCARSGAILGGGVGGAVLLAAAGAAAYAAYRWLT